MDRSARRLASRTAQSVGRVTGRQGVRPNSDVGPDDRQIVALLPAAASPAQSTNHVTLMSGVLDEIRRKVP